MVPEALLSFLTGVALGGHLPMPIHLSIHPSVHPPGPRRSRSASREGNSAVTATRTTLTQARREDAQSGVPIPGRGPPEDTDTDTDYIDSRGEGPKSCDAGVTVRETARFGAVGGGGQREEGEGWGAVVSGITCHSGAWPPPPLSRCTDPLLCLSGARFCHPGPGCFWTAGFLSGDQRCCSGPWH